MILSYHNSRSHNLREVGIGQKYSMILLHSMWFLSMIIEDYYFHTALELNIMKIILIIILFFASTLRIISMMTLKKMWSTKVYALRKENVITSGIYKYFRHPNYFAVFLEITLLPILFDLYYTALVFTLFNSIFLFLRIRLENRFTYGEIS